MCARSLVCQTVCRSGRRPVGGRSPGWSSHRRRCRGRSGGRPRPPVRRFPVGQGRRCRGAVAGSRRAPAIDDDPQSKLLTQVQGVIAEYERAKIAERYRRGKLFRSRAGEVIAWRVPYGYRRLPRDGAGPARLEIYEPEADVVRRIFHDTVAGGCSTREISRRLAADQVSTPSGRRAIWGTSTISRLLRNEAYIGRLYFNRTETVPAPASKKGHRQVVRPADEWVAIPVPPIIDEQTFTAESKAMMDNTKWSPRRDEPGQWLFKGLVRCGVCGVGTNAHRMRGRNGSWHRYYYCRNHDPIRAGGADRRCPERNIRAEALDTYVFDRIRSALLHPGTLLTGEQAVAARTPAPDDELLAAELVRLDRKITAADDDGRRLADLYQAGLLGLPEVQRRAADIEHRRKELTGRRDDLTTQRRELSRDNKIRSRVEGFAGRITAVIDHLDAEQKQKLLRLLVEEVRVTGWNVQIQLRIPLDAESQDQPPASDGSPVSSQDRLRSIRGHHRRVLPHARRPPNRHHQPNLTARDVTRDRAGPDQHPTPPNPVPGR